MAQAQPAQVKLINGKYYLVMRGRAAVLLGGGGTPVLQKSRLLTLSLEASKLGGPVIAPEIDRSALPGLYGTYKPSINFADYRQSTVGARNRMADLNEYNSPNTQEFVWPSGRTSLTIQNAILYGRWRNPPYPVYLENCIMRGPASFVSNESAVFDLDNPTTSQQSQLLDVTIAPQFPHPNLNALKGRGFKAERVHTFYAVDSYGTYTKLGSSAPTNVEIVGSLSGELVYFPGSYYANQSPYYWNGTDYLNTTSGAIARSAADYIDTRWIDYGHPDGNHSDGIEIHGSIGSHTYNPATNRWTGNGTHVWATAFNTTDAYDVVTDPSALGIPVPGRGVPANGLGTLGWGDNHKRGLPTGGQKPGQTRPFPLNTAFTRRQMDGKFAANGSGIIILQLNNQFPNPTSVLVHDVWLNGGGAGMQEQRKGYSSIQFTAYNIHMGPGWFPWGPTDSYANLNQYPVRIYDASSAAATINGAVVRIDGRPSTHPDGARNWYETIWWDDPTDLYGGRDGQLVPLGRQGIRFAA